jgi:lipoate-protein ligase A
MITIFRNIKETSTPFFKDIEFVLERIKNGKYIDLINQIREEEDKSARNELKKNLPAVCFSGTFNRRSDDAIIEHSGYICLDFDGYENHSDMFKEKKKMIADKYVMSVFVSPSGNGLKAIVKIPKEPNNHKRYFDALKEYFDSPYFDVTSKNISRVCYESYDPEIHVNLDSELWDTLSDLNSKPIERSAALNTIPVTDEKKIIDRITRWWERKWY